MVRAFCLILFSIAFVSIVSSVPLSTSPNPAATTLNALSRRGEPSTGDDDFEDIEPHPNPLDQVETAFTDAIWIVGLAIKFIEDDADTDIFPHYFNDKDRSGVKSVFEAIKGKTTDPENPSMGNDLLSDIHVQRQDTEGLCTDPRTLAYMHDGETDHPAIVLCDTAFKKKAMLSLKGADPQKDEDKKWFMTCDAFGQDTHVSYLMNVLGATLVHEYLHFDRLVESIFGAPIIDQADANNVPIGYGPVQVYDSLSKDLAPFNADSYTYYALHVTWTFLCGKDFQAPRAGVDDQDPDCGGEVCTN